VSVLLTGTAVRQFPKPVSRHPAALYTDVLGSLKVDVAFLRPLTNAVGVLVLLHTSSADDWVTVCGPAPQKNWADCPASMLIANGTIRRSPILGATTTCEGAVATKPLVVFMTAAEMVDAVDVALALLFEARPPGGI